jgi:hypothetical protein
LNEHPDSLLPGEVVVGRTYELRGRFYGGFREVMIVRVSELSPRRHVEVEHPVHGRFYVLLADLAPDDAPL